MKSVTILIVFIAIIAHLRFSKAQTLEDIACKNISGTKVGHLQFAQSMGYLDVVTKVEDNCNALVSLSGQLLGQFFSDFDILLKLSTQGRGNFCQVGPTGMEFNGTLICLRDFQNLTITFSNQVVQFLSNGFEVMLNNQNNTGLCEINNQTANDTLAEWQKVFPDAVILIQTADVIVITHTMGDGILMKINGLESKSPLSNNALYSFECAGGNYLNLYEVMVPDIPDVEGDASTAQIYVGALRDNGLDVAGIHFHWWGSEVYEEDKGVTAIHHQKYRMNPVEFSKRTIAAIQKAMMAIENRLC